MEEKFDYARVLAELEDLIAKVEDPSTSFDDIEACIMRSRELTAACRDFLRGVSVTMEKL